MNALEVQSALLEKFENARIVFWHDAESEFSDMVNKLELGAVRLERIDAKGGLELKILLEVEETEPKFLLYSESAEPEFDNDWLYDIRVYSEKFSADRASLILGELGLKKLELKEEIQERKKFFDNKKRLEALKSFCSPDDSAEELKLKMLAVAVGAKRAELDETLRQVFSDMCSEEEAELDVSPKVLKQIESFELENFFWKQFQNRFMLEEKPANLKTLLLKVFVSEFYETLSQTGRDSFPENLSSNLLSPAGRKSAAIFLDHWRDSSKHSSNYNKIAHEVSNLLGINETLSSLRLEAFGSCTTFFEIEKAILGEVATELCQEKFDSSSLLQVCTQRQNDYWAKTNSRTEAERSRLVSAYSALQHASKFLELKSSFPQGFSFENAKDAYRQYTDTLYKFDQLYRHFLESVKEFSGSTSLRKLKENIEQHYLGWFIDKLELAWGSIVEKELLKDWQIEGIPNQHQFYKKHVLSYTNPVTKSGGRSKQNRKAFVIISDGLRYEAAEELSRRLNSEYRFKAELGSQLGVLPSYTQLGMAALLPWDTLKYKHCDKLRVNGRASSGLSARNKILDEHNSLAIYDVDLLNLSVPEGRELTAGKNSIYIYEKLNIDSLSEKEGKSVLLAARNCLNNLSSLVRYLINSLNATHIIITSDHGFMYMDSEFKETDRSRLPELPDEVLRDKRYILGKNLPKNPDVWQGNTKITALASGEMDFWVPKGASRFYFTGGARYFHGGAMPQEVVVPVLTIREENNKKKKKNTKSRPVKVELLGAASKITAQSHRFEFIQMEALSDRVLPLLAKVFIQDPDTGKTVSSIESVTFNSRSENIDERKQSVLIRLSGEEFDKHKSYKLLLKDEDEIERLRVDIKIDRVIRDDFGF